MVSELRVPQVEVTCQLALCKVIQALGHFWGPVQELGAGGLFPFICLVSEP